jgi:uncharacterized protein YsxB (DUF464 family)
MIRVTCSRQEDRWELRVSGHAGTAPYGKDLVCAAATALVCALAKYVSEQEPEEAPTLRLEPGDAEITAKGKQLAPAFETVCAGLELLAEAYPENVRWER